MPSGAPIANPSTVMIRLPMIALRSPPEAPGGGVISVNTAGVNPHNPCQSSAARIRTRNAKPKAEAAMHRPITIVLLRRRVR